MKKIFPCNDKMIAQRVDGVENFGKGQRVECRQANSEQGLDLFVGRSCWKSQIEMQ